MKRTRVYARPRGRLSANGVCLVKFGESLSASECSAYPFKKGSTLLYLGEIRNMPGHCAVVEVASGKMHVGYHSDVFKEIPESET